MVGDPASALQIDALGCADLAGDVVIYAISPANAGAASPADLAV